MSGFTLKLDPSAIAPDRTELDINTGAIRTGSIDWGDAEVTAYETQEGDYGNSVAAIQLPNRTITIQLGLGMDDGAGGVTQEQARAKLQQKVALLQREGGQVLRQRSIADPAMYADVVKAVLTPNDVWGETGGVEQWTLVLETLPDFYGDEVTLDSISATGVCASVLKASGVQAVIQGDYPGRCRIIVTDTSGKAQQGILWGYRSRHYDPAATAALTYEAEALTPLNGASSTALTGASGGNVLKVASLAQSWVSYLSTEIVSGSAQLTHKGSYRLWARVRTAAETEVLLRFAYCVGALTHPTVNNEQAIIPGPASQYVVDLGPVRIDAAAVGTHYWCGVIQAFGTSGGEDLEIDKLYLVPVDESTGSAVASIDPEVGLTAFLARDDFNGVSLVSPPVHLPGHVAAIGGTWSTTPSVTPDFTYLGTVVTGFDVSAEIARGAAGDTSANVASVGSVSVSANVVVTADFRWDITTGGLNDALFSGVVAGTTNGVTFQAHDDGTGLQWLEIAGTRATAVTIPMARARNAALDPADNDTLLLSGEWYTITLAIINGNVYGWLSNQGAPLGEPDIVSVTTGTLAGSVGFIDNCPGSGGTTSRLYDNFAAWVPPTDSVIFASETMEIRSDSIIRADSAGAYSQVKRTFGDLARIPPSGLEARPVEVFVKPSRGDLDALADGGLDGFTVQVKYRPCYLSRP